MSRISKIKIHPFYTMYYTVNTTYVSTVLWYWYQVCYNCIDPLRRFRPPVPAPEVPDQGDDPGNRAVPEGNTLRRRRRGHRVHEAHRPEAESAAQDSGKEEKMVGFSRLYCTNFYPKRYCV